MEILGFGTYDAGRHPRVGILLEGFRAQRDHVVEINEPLGFTTAERVEMLKRPWKAVSLVTRLVGHWTRLVRRARRVDRSDLDAVIVGYMGHLDVLLAAVLFRQTTVVLDQLIFAADTARDRRIDSSLKLRLLRLLDRAAIRAADLVLVDTPEHLDLVPDAGRARSLVVPVGAPPAWFEAAATAARTAPGAAPVADRPLSVVFFGLYTPLQGATTIGRALAELTGCDAVTVTMIGNGQDHAETRTLAEQNPMVRWIDWIDPDELPALVAGHDVNLGIFATTPKALRVVPNKVYQGAAAGCAIVTSDTEPQRRALGDAAVFVPAGDAPALAGALRALAGDRAHLHTMRERARTLARERFSAESVVGELRRRLEAPPGTLS